MSHSLTTGAPWRVLLWFSIPLLLGSIVQQAYQFADAIVVGRHLGVNSLGAVGATTSLMFLLLGFAMGLANGFAIPTAQAFGARDAAAVRRSVAAGTMLSAGASVILTVAAPLLSGPLLQIMQTPEALLPEATTFAQVSFIGSGALMFFNYYSAIIRAIGDSRTPLAFLTISCLLNIGLVIVMVATFEWGVGGAALATVVAQAVSVVLCIVYIRVRIPELRVRREDWKASRSVVREHLRLGLPMGFQTSIISIGTLTVQVALNGLGPDAVAAYTTGMRVDGIAMAFLMSLGLAASTYVAQNYGAGRPDRIRNGVAQAVWMAVIIGAALGALVFFAGAWFVDLFVGGQSQTVVDLAALMLKVNGVAYVALAVLFVLRGALQGLGDALVPTVSGIIELVMRVVAAIVLGALFGYVGVVLSNPLAWIGAIVLLIPAWVRARRKLADVPVAPVDGVITATMPISVQNEGSDFR